MAVGKSWRGCDLWDGVFILGIEKIPVVGQASGKLNSILRNSKNSVSEQTCKSRPSLRRITEITIKSPGTIGSISEVNLELKSKCGVHLRVLLVVCMTRLIAVLSQTHFLTRDAHGHAT